MPRASLLVPAVLFVALAHAGCSEPEVPAATPRAGAGARDVDAPLPNLLLVVLDTVRADHLSCYGYERPTSPAVDAFAARATRFTRALSSAPWTLPSHASMMTGLAPTEHRVHTVLSESGAVLVRPLARRRHTLAEGLSELGYRTGAQVANAAYLDARYGLDQGFETYQAAHQEGRLVTRRAIEWLRDEDDGRPWFLFVNYMDAHRPYTRTARESIVPEPVDRDGVRLLRRLIYEVMPGERDADPELAQRVIDQYDLGVASADEAFGSLLDHARGREDAHRTLVVLTSDHGEYFGEHRLVEHSKDVYQPVLHVPLVIGWLEGVTGRLDDRVVDSSDLPGLVLEAARAAGHDGWAPLSRRFGRAPAARLPRILSAYAREKDYAHELWGHRFGRVRHATVEWPWKLIHSTDGAHELYHLEEDPQERVNRYAQEPRVAAHLRSALALEGNGVPARVPDTELVETSPEELERLRALGYAE